MSKKYTPASRLPPRGKRPKKFHDEYEALWARLWWPPEGQEEKQCWLWPYSVTHDGHGRVRWQGKLAYTHRLAYELFYETKIALGKRILHACDVPNCCNPMHLRIGTDADNANDRRQRNRGGNLKGEGNGRSLLTEECVKQMRLEWYRLSCVPRKRGQFPKEDFAMEMAKKYNVHPNSIKKACRHETWTHVK